MVLDQVFISWCKENMKKKDIFYLYVINISRSTVQYKEWFFTFKINSCTNQTNSHCSDYEETKRIHEIKPFHQRFSISWSKNKHLLYISTSNSNHYSKLFSNCTKITKRLLEKDNRIIFEICLSICLQNTFSLL